MDSRVNLELLVWVSIHWLVFVQQSIYQVQWEVELDLCETSNVITFALRNQAMWTYPKPFSFFFEYLAAVFWIRVGSKNYELHEQNSGFWLTNELNRCGLSFVGDRLIKCARFVSVTLK